jgi:hypothetical protein
VLKTTVAVKVLSLPVILFGSGGYLSQMQWFVSPDSIVRRIWGRSDTILFIFAGASAEFALNKAVDWLYFTGKLPADPLGRLFSTVRYARSIVFSSQEDADKAINTIYSIHKGVESARGSVIPDWAYRDVLYMLIHYSIASFELLERKLTVPEKEEVYHVFYRVGKGLQLKDLPPGYTEWLQHRESHMNEHLFYSHFTKDLFKQYKKHLGFIRYKLLLEAQLLVVPKQVKRWMKMNRPSMLLPVVPLYKLSRKLKLDGVIKNILLPQAYKSQIKALDMVPG